MIGCIKSRCVFERVCRLVQREVERGEKRVVLRLCACRLDDMERDVFAEDQMSILELDVSTDWIVYRQREDQDHCFQ